MALTVGMTAYWDGTVFIWTKPGLVIFGTVERQNRLNLENSKNTEARTVAGSTRCKQKGSLRSVCLFSHENKVCLGIDFEFQQM